MQKWKPIVVIGLLGGGLHWPARWRYLFEMKSIAWNTTSVLGLAYVAVFPALLAYCFCSLGVAAAGAARAGVFLYLTPVFGSPMGVLLRAEQFGLHRAIGMALIVAGVTIASRKWAG